MDMKSLESRNKKQERLMFLKQKAGQSISTKISRQRKFNMLFVLIQWGKIDATQKQ